MAFKESQLASETVKARTKLPAALITQAFYFIKKQVARRSPAPQLPDVVTSEAEELTEGLTFYL